jgi:hypothetical protein
LWKGDPARQAESHPQAVSPPGTPRPPLPPRGHHAPKNVSIPPAIFEDFHSGSEQSQSHRNPTFLKLVPHTPITPQPPSPRPSSRPPGPAPGGMVGPWVPNPRAGEPLVGHSGVRACVRARWSMGKACELSGGANNIEERRHRTTRMNPETLRRDG